MNFYEVAILALLGLIALQLTVIAFFLIDGLGRIRARLRSIDDTNGRICEVADRHDIMNR